MKGCCLIPVITFPEVENSYEIPDRVPIPRKGWGAQPTLLCATTIGYGS